MDGPPLRLLAAALVGAILAAGAWIAAGMRARPVPGSELVIGEAIPVAVDAAADSLRVTYRPGSWRARTEVIPIRGRDTVWWAPRHTGLVALRGGIATRYVGVRPAARGANGTAAALAAIALAAAIAVAAIRLRQRRAAARRGQVSGGGRTPAAPTRPSPGSGRRTSGPDRPRSRT